MEYHSHARRILLFGASGRTGALVLAMALEAGNEVTAVVRNAAKLSVDHPNLTIVEGDSTVFSSFKDAAKGKDTLVSCIGVSSNGPTTLYSQSTSNMLKAMGGAGIRRILCVSAAGIETNPKLPFVHRFISKHIVQRVFRHPYADCRSMEAMLRESNTEWTAVRPPMLQNRSFTGKYRYRANGWLAHCIRINRADLACFLLESIDNPETYRAVVEVAN